MSEDKRTYTRDLGLIVVAFVATLVLLAGLVMVFGSRPGVVAGPGTSPTAPPPTAASAEPGGSGTPGSPSAPPATASPSVVPSDSGSGDPVLVGAGDIAMCSRDDDESTARLLDAMPGTVFAAGDNAYEDGSEEQYRECYEPTWGRHLERTRAVPGNHDYQTTDAAGYKAYFGDASAGPDGETWYSFDLGTWHVVMLDSNCDDVGCEHDSPQGRWLTADLAASDARCTVAIWHHPRFSSGFHGNDRDVAPFWEILHAGGADVVLNGHDHDYERFAPQDPDGEEDRVRGVREFVVGTGGATLRPFEAVVPNSELRYAVTPGIFAMTLHDGRYDWQFVPTSGRFSDRGSAACH
ncbi:MAG TPA: metallophosphoesterase [Candidatus Limnocylindrales bacterium]|nr:metallophosphoesterase [Candidatus Limnocylindrales bacterium]